jgi:hypothetical protein
MTLASNQANWMAKPIHDLLTRFAKMTPGGKMTVGKLRDGTPKRVVGRNVAAGAVTLRLSRMPVQREWLHAKLIDAAKENGIYYKAGERVGSAALAKTMQSAYVKANCEGLPRDWPHPDDDGPVQARPRPEFVTRTPAQRREALDNARHVFRKWLGDLYDLDALWATLATAAVENLDGDPTWLLLVAGSGGAKTETVCSLKTFGAEVVSSIVSEAALLSATPKRERANDATGGLLNSMTRGIVVVKDVTTILSMSRDERGKVLAALREIYDGHWARLYGSDGGNKLEWTGRLVVIGAVTTAWDTAHTVVSIMGNRFVLCRIDSRDANARRAAQLQAIKNTGDEIQMRAELAEAVRNVLVGADPEGIAVDERDAILIGDAANLVTLVRSPVEFDQGVVVDDHAPEWPTRFARQLVQIMRGAVSIGLSRENGLRLAMRCARDSMPPLRFAILEYLAKCKQAMPSEVAAGLGGWCFSRGGLRHF